MDVHGLWECLLWVLVQTVLVAATSCPLLPDAYPCECNTVTIHTTTRIQVDCTRRRLRTIPDFSRFKALPIAHLRLDHNDITTVPDRVFDELLFRPLNGIEEDVAVLDLGHNPLMSLPPSAFDGIRADNGLAIRLENCSFNDVPMEALTGLHSLTHLHLANNYIEVLHDNTFQGISKLSHLYLGSNPISYIEGQTFSGLDHTLEFLDLSRTQLNVFPVDPLIHLEKLEYLLFDGSAMRHIREGGVYSVDQGTSLKVLSFQGCQFDDLDGNIFLPGTLKLQVLNFKHNHIKDVKFLQDYKSIAGVRTNIDVKGNDILCNCDFYDLLTSPAFQGFHLTGRCSTRSRDFDGVSFSQFSSLGREECREEEEDLENSPTQQGCHGDHCSQGVSHHKVILLVTIALAVVLIIA